MYYGACEKTFVFHTLLLLFVSAHLLFNSVCLLISSARLLFNSVHLLNRSISPPDGLVLESEHFFLTFLASGTRKVIYIFL